jgi:hypothetical protein
VLHLDHLKSSTLESFIGSNQTHSKKHDLQHVGAPECILNNFFKNVIVPLASSTLVTTPLFDVDASE